MLFPCSVAILFLAFPCLLFCFNTAVCHPHTRVLPLFSQSPPTRLLHTIHVVPAPPPPPFDVLPSFSHPKSSDAPTISSVFRPALKTSPPRFHRISGSLAFLSHSHARRRRPAVASRPLSRSDPHSLITKPGACVLASMSVRLPCKHVRTHRFSSYASSGSTSGSRYFSTTLVTCSNVSWTSCRFVSDMAYLDDIDVQRPPACFLF